MAVRQERTLDARLQGPSRKQQSTEAQKGRSMARTQAADYEERKESILDHAARLFATRGFPGTSIMDIARACGASKSLLYHYFPSKEDVLFGVMNSHIDVLLHDIEQVAKDQQHPADALHSLLELFMRDYAGAASRQKVLLNELRNLPDDKRTEIVAKQRQIIAAFQDLLSAAIPTAGNDPARMRARTMLLFGMINWTSNWFKPGGQLSSSDIADMAFDLVLGGQGAAAPARS